MSDLPYRPCVGVALMNAEGLIFIGRRQKRRGGEVAPNFEWQMPQGGIDAGESPADAARRELREETNVSSASVVAEAPDWLNYDLPDSARGRWRGRYRGQTQRWFLMRFEGEEREIDILNPDGGAHDPEFEAWRWERLEATPDLVVPFKRDVYVAVVKAFQPLVAARGG